MLVNKMKKVAKEKNIDADIVALPTSDMYNQIGDADVILLGPQARYLLAEVKGTAAKNGIPVEVIDSRLYGMMDGAAILDQALRLAKQK